MKCVVFSLLAVFIALSAADYGHHHGGLHETVHPGPAKVLTYPGKVPVPPCGMVYLLSCNKNSEKVPCTPEKEHHHYAPAKEHYHHAPAKDHYHAPAPAKDHYHAPAPAKDHYHAPAPAKDHYHAPAPAKEHHAAPAKY